MLWKREMGVQAGKIRKHARQRSTCKECGGASICQHARRRSECKECGGGSICQHARRRSRCKTCIADKDESMPCRCRRAAGSRGALRSSSSSTESLTAPPKDASLLFSVFFSLTSLFLLLLVALSEVTVTSVSNPPFVSRRGLSNTFAMTAPPPSQFFSTSLLVLLHLFQLLPLLQ